MIDPREFARVLASGCAGSEHSPQAAARLIEHLARDNDVLVARVAELEQLAMSKRMQGPLANAYARGWRECQRALVATVPPGSAAEDQIMAPQPDYTAAVRAVVEAV